MIKIILAVVALIIAFIIWRLISVFRGANQRDKILMRRIDGILKRIRAGETVSTQEVEELAAHPENRYILFSALRQINKDDLFPGSYSSSISQGESALAYWMMHPHELQDAPDKIEYIETFKRHVNDHDSDFHVYRYKMPPGHWAAKDGWILGLTGPMANESAPYSALPGAFSRAGDVEGTVTPAELVDWYIGMLRQKGIIT